MRSSLAHSRPEVEGPKCEDLKHSRKVPAFIFLVCILVYNSNGRIISTGDSVPARLLPFTLLCHGTVIMDEYLPRDPQTYWFSFTRNGHLASFYPIILPVLIVPLFVPAAVYVCLANPDWTTFMLVCEVMEKFTASVIASLSVVFVWLALCQIASGRTAVILTFTYAFATQTWSTSSQALWQHGLGQLLLAITLWLLARFGGSPRYAFITGVVCGLMTFNRLPDAFFAAAVAVFYLLYAPGSRVRFGLGMALASAPFLTYNLVLFGRVLGAYYAMIPAGFFRYSIRWGVAGLLVSPGKGLLVYAPFFLFLTGAPLLKLGRAGRAVSVFLWLACLGQLILYGRMDWTGGACYGPRFLSDPLPFLVLCLATVLERLKARLFRAALYICVLFGVWIQAVGVYCFPNGGTWSFTMDDQWKGPAFLLEARAGVAEPRLARQTLRFIKDVLRRPDPSKPVW